MEQEAGLNRSYYASFLPPLDFSQSHLHAPVPYSFKNSAIGLEPMCRAFPYLLNIAPAKTDSLFQGLDMPGLLMLGSSTQTAFLKVTYTHP